MTAPDRLTPEALEAAIARALAVEGESPIVDELLDVLEQLSRAAGQMRVAQTLAAERGGAYNNQARRLTRRFDELHAALGRGLGLTE